MVVYAIFFVPETAGVPLESIYLLFEGNIIAGATRDTIPRASRAKHLKNVRNVEMDDGKGSQVDHVERVDAKGADVVEGRV